MERSPSTDWKEVIPDGEAARMAALAQRMVEMVQRRRTKEFGQGRALHRKQLAGLRATFEVLPNLPVHARFGVFAQPGSHDALIRVSNGGTRRQADVMPDIRGFAVKIRGVSGPSALGEGMAREQDFLFINQSKFAFSGGEEFVEFVCAADQGGASLFGFLLKPYGVLGTGRLLKQFATSLKRPFTGFATESLYTTNPIACGPYAMRLRLLPASADVDAEACKDFGADLGRRLAAGPLKWTLQAQFFVDESVTPIEDAKVDWPETESPYVSLARVHAPGQDLQSAAGRKQDADIEALAFDPWHALMEHRPLGSVMRMRKAAYFASARERGAA